MARSLPPRSRRGSRSQALPALSHLCLNRHLLSQHTDLRLFAPSLQAALATLPEALLLQLEPRRLTVLLPLDSTARKFADQLSFAWEAQLGPDHPLLSRCRAADPRHQLLREEPPTLVLTPPEPPPRPPARAPPPGPREFPMPCFFVVQLHFADPMLDAYVDLTQYAPSLHAAAERLPGVVLGRIERRRLTLLVTIETYESGRTFDLFTRAWEEYLGPDHPLRLLLASINDEAHLLVEEVCAQALAPSLEPQP
jgi:hypothetical protein